MACTDPSCQVSIVADPGKISIGPQKVEQKHMGNHTLPYALGGFYYEIAHSIEYIWWANGCLGFGAGSYLALL